MQSGNISQLSEAEVAALLKALKRDGLRSITREWPRSATPSEEPKRKGRKMDPINPEHYKKGEIECIDAIRSALTEDEWRGFLKGTSMAYLWRLGHKDSVQQDARKTLWYVEWLAGNDPRK